MQRVKSKSLFCSLAVVLFSIVASVAHARDRMVFTCVMDKSEPQHDVFLRLYRDAFDALDRDFSFQLVSGSRAIAETVSGRVDGNCARVGNFIELSGMRELVRVDVPIATIGLQVWSRSPQLSVRAGEAFLDVGHRVGYMRGFKLIENYLASQGDIIKMPVTAVDLGIKMLAAGRTDFYLGQGFQVNNVIQRTNIRRSIYLAGTLMTNDLYPYLHQRHKYLAVPLATELKRLIDARGWPIK